VNVAILVKEFPPDAIGGTETQTRRMARKLSDRGHDVTVYTKAYGTDRADDEEPMKIVRVPNIRINPFLSTLTFVVIVTLLLLRDAKKYDVLQCMMIYPNGFVGYILNRFVDLPYFAWIRGGDYYFMKDTPVKRWMIKKVLGNGLVLTVSERVIDDVIEEFPGTQLEAVPNGVPIIEMPCYGNAIIFVGRLKKQKGVDKLLRAAKNIDRPVVIVGDGPARSSLERLSESIQVNAEFVGEVAPDEVPEYLQRGDIFVLPSVRGEGGAPNAMLEAMAAGLPVIVTDTGGMLKAVETEPIGFMVPPGDIGALRDRLELLCNDEEFRRELGANAREYVRRTHSWDVVCDQLENVYKRVIADSNQ
jgi:glycosyltransferase involved in cell wall biosynthesis